VPNAKKYLEELARRKKESHVHRKFQLDGLEIAKMLGDEKHKSLYIKLAKQHDPQNLRRLAKEVLENKNIRNPGAYFMSCLKTKNTNGETADRNHS